MSNPIVFPDPFSQPGVAAPIATNDLTAMKTLLDQITLSGEKASKTLANGFGAAAVNGRSFNETLLSIAQSLARVAVHEGTRSLTTGLTNTLSDLFKTAFAGNAPVEAHADGLRPLSRKYECPAHAHPPDQTPAPAAPLAAPHSAKPRPGAIMRPALTFPDRQPFAVQQSSCCILHAHQAKGYP